MRFRRGNPDPDSGRPTWWFTVDNGAELLVILWQTKAECYLKSRSTGKVLEQSTFDLEPKIRTARDFDLNARGDKQDYLKAQIEDWLGSNALPAGRGHRPKATKAAKATKATEGKDTPPPCAQENGPPSFRFSDFEGGQELLRAMIMSDRVFPQYNFSVLEYMGDTLQDVKRLRIHSIDLVVR